MDGFIPVDPSSRGNFKGTTASGDPLDNNGNARVEFVKEEPASKNNKNKNKKNK
ncbi:MAG: hypothetical protein IKU58_04280 [Clostridia bacterium]|nr:hypothetical protein [Clostridia bacterium]